ncbi:MAG: CDP-diacylglycerol--serine O-phosphatidyltransferase [Gammaproteobacteria bacterium]|nr:CDP-diacylglycerol--serine O-phosphatidyltransferase [Gammaproteobacteria bacterium]MDH5650945.1 CDP-diacylglycerol--serine O-phosphatidyltransferase [Gammaproteobacteria bacterium]
MIRKIREGKARRGIYLLPNLFTTASLFTGFFAIVAAIDHRFESAAIAIFIAMLMDGIDGRVARMTHTESDFGAEYDSLSDMISFGIGPALVVYGWALNTMGKLGWLVAFIYTAGAALRLARFNTQVGIADKAYFQGLPSPAAAGIVAGLVWVGETQLASSPLLDNVAMGLTFWAGVLMVSNLRYYSFKTINWKGKVPFVSLLLFVAIIVTISSNPPLMLFGGFVIYSISGIFITLIQMLKNRGEGKLQPATDPEPDQEQNAGP